MHLRLAVVLTLMLAATPVAAQPGVQRPIHVPDDLPRVQDLAPTDHASIRTSVDGQLRAFRRQDGRAAFDFASPVLQRQFGSPEDFMAMVRREYAELLQAAVVEHLDLVWFRGYPTQRTRVRTDDGQTVMALYMMRKVAGAWRIAGCILLRPPEGLSQLGRWRRHG